MINIPGTVDVPNGIIDFPIPQSIGDSVLVSDWRF